MVAPRFRSRTFRRVNKKLPGGKTVVCYVKRKPKLGSCSVTGKKLKGVPRERPYKMKKLGISRKRPSRPYGGVLSANALKSLIKKRVREEENV